MANTDDLTTAVKNLEEAFVKDLNNGQPLDWSQTGYVLLGNDTRESSPELLNLVKMALTQLGCKFIEFGQVTTP